MAEYCKAAVDEVGRLLQHSSDLSRLSVLQHDAQHSNHRCDAQVAGTVSSHLDKCQAGMSASKTAAEAIASIQNAFQEIDRLCEESAVLIDHHDKIRLLGMVQGNLFKTLFDAENIAELPHEATAAEELLQSNANLFQAYCCLAALEGTANLAEKTLDATDALNEHELKRLDRYFLRVREAMAQFETRLFQLTRDIVAVGRDAPDVLTTCMRIIEIQEQIDMQALAGVAAKRYLERARASVALCVQDTFGEMLREVKAANAANQLPPAQLDQILGQATQLCLVLVEAFDGVGPCCPPQWQLQDLIITDFHAHVRTAVDGIGSLAHAMPTKSILQVVQWIGEFEDTCSNLSSDTERPRLDSEAHIGYTQLVKHYAACTYDLLHSWVINIVQADMRDSPKLGSDGRFWTLGAVDLFQTIDEQVALVVSHSTGFLLFQTVLAILAILDEYQEAQVACVKRGLQVDALCAVINNSSRCYDDASAFSERIQSLLIEPYQDDELGAPQVAAFLRVATQAVHSISNSIFEDDALQALLHQVGSDQWLQGGVLERILATLEDYLDEYTTYIHPNFALKLAAECATTAAAHYVAATCAHVNSSGPSVAVALASDAAAFKNFAERQAHASKIAAILQPLADVAQLLVPSGPDSVALAFTSLHTAHPRLTVAMLEGVILSRFDSATTDGAKAVADCKRIAAESQLGGNDSALPDAKPTKLSRADVFQTVLASMLN